MSRAEWIRSMIKEGLDDDAIIEKIMGTELPEGVKVFPGDRKMAELTVRKQRKNLA